MARKVEDLTGTREAWLRRAIEVFRPRFEEVGFPLPDKIRVSVGFGSTGARQENSRILGVTYVTAAAADGVNEIFISPEDADTTSMLATLLHELVHVADDGKSGHKGDFAEAATRLGLEGPMPATKPSLTLAVELMTIVDSLGEYPGSYLVLPDRTRVPVGPSGIPTPRGPKVHTGPGTQTTRYQKRSCENLECESVDPATGTGYTVRVTQKWLAMAAPICPVCSQAM